MLTIDKENIKNLVYLFNLRYEEEYTIKKMIQMIGHNLDAKTLTPSL